MVLPLRYCQLLGQAVAQSAVPESAAHLVKRLLLVGALVAREVAAARAGVQEPLALVAVVLVAAGQQASVQRGRVIVGGRMPRPSRGRACACVITGSAGCAKA